MKPTSYPLRIPDESQSPIANQAAAQQGRGMLVRIARRDRKAVPLVGDHHLRVAPVDVVADKASPIELLITTGKPAAVVASRI